MYYKQPAIKEWEVMVHLIEGKGSIYIIWYFSALEIHLFSYIHLFTSIQSLISLGMDSLIRLMTHLDIFCKHCLSSTV